jgi:hypothetical protein
MLNRGYPMAEQFDVRLVEEAKYCTPPPGYREKARIRDYEEKYRYKEE